MDNASLQKGRRIRLKGGDLVFQQGDPIDSIHLLVSGRVKVVFHPERRVGAAPEQAAPSGRAVGIVETPGTILAEHDARLRARGASVVAVGAVVLESARIAPARVAAALSERPTFGLAVARGMARRLRETYHAVYLAGESLDRLQHDVDRHCLAYYRAVEEMASSARQSLDVKKLRLAATRSFSYRRGRQHAEEPIGHAGRTDRTATTSAKAVRALDPGELLCREGDPIHHLYVVESGRLEIAIGERTIELVESGGLLGEVGALLPESPRHVADIRAATETRLTAIARDQLEQAFQTQPKLLLHTIRTLARRLEEAGKTICAIDTFAQNLLQALDGAEHCCYKDLADLSESAAPFAGVVGDAWLQGLREQLVAARQDSADHQAQLREVKRTIDDGISCGRSRGRLLLDEFESQLSDLVTRLCASAGADPASSLLRQKIPKLKTFERLARDLARSRPLVAAVHLEPAGASSLIAHSLGVALWALALAERLRLGSSARSNLALGCLLHDIGTIHRWDDHDYQALRHTTDYADHWLRPLGELPAPVRSVIQQHHETVSGEGFPLGLRGDRIDFLARVASAANYVDLLIGKGYRLEEIAAAVEAHREHFDERVVAALHEVLAEQQSRPPDLERAELEYIEQHYGQGPEV